MARPSDKEYVLIRKIRDLEQKIRNLENENAELKKKQNKLEQSQEVKPKKSKEQCCPSCGSTIKSSVLPFGTLQICAEGCGWRNVKRG